MIRIDGSYGEGGGQILRTSISLSAITGKPIEIFNIRAKREKPGLRPQHVMAIRSLAELCNAEVENLAVGASTVRFVPGRMRSGMIRMDIGTAGSITMVLQAVVPAVSISGNEAEIELIGGTDVRWSPTLDYFRYVLQHAYNMIGIPFEIEAKKRGYYPIGGGIVRAKIKPAKLNILEMITAPKIEPRIISVCAMLPKHVAERQIAAALTRLEKESVRCSSYSASMAQSASPGSSILVYSVSDYGPFLGGDSIGERGKPAEKVGTEAAEAFLEGYLSNATVDKHLADMLVLPLSLANGRSKFIVDTVTQHLETNLYVVSNIVECKYGIEKRSNNVMVTIEGKGI